MKIITHFIPEPQLEFGGHFLHVDKKTGLSEHGPFGKTDAALHPSQIRVGVVGTRSTVEMCERWIDECRSEIETDKSQKRQRVRFRPEELFDEDAIVDALIKGLTPDFVGVAPNTPFATTIISAERWRSTFTDREARAIAELTSDVQRVERTTDLLCDHIERIATTAPAPDVIFIALPEILHKDSVVAQLPNNRWLNLRRGLKARAMKWGVPIQIIWEDVLSGKRTSLRDKATRAWNFATALYFKAGGVPWRGHGLESDTCYIGITFYQSENSAGKTVMRSGVAQAFDYLGQGVVLRGEPFEWDADEFGKSPHLSREAAARLMKSTLTEYQRISRLPPKRVVVHKSSRFWGREHPEFNELDGFFEGVESFNSTASASITKPRMSASRSSGVSSCGRETLISRASCASRRFSSFSTWFQRDSPLSQPFRGSLRQQNFLMNHAALRAVVKSLPLPLILQTLGSPIGCYSHHGTTLAVMLTRNDLRFEMVDSQGGDGFCFCCCLTPVARAHLCREAMYKCTVMT